MSTPLHFQPLTELAARLARRERRTGRGIAGTDHQHIDLEIVHLALLLHSTSPGTPK